MLGLALSGGGVRGAIQCGCLIALTERGIRPNVVAGTSAGALNGLAYCLNPTLDGLGYLKFLWNNVKRGDIWPGGPISWAWAALTGKLGLVSYEHLLHFIEKWMDFVFRRHDLTYATLQIPLRVTAVDVITRKPIVFGYPEDSDKSLAVTVTASAALPGVSEPVPYLGTLYSDGGLTDPLPIGVLVDNGAKEIYAIDLSGTDTPYKPANILEAGMAYFDCQQNELAAHGIREALSRNITLHHISISFDVGLLDFSHAQEMIEYGYREMIKYLDNPTPVRRHRET